MTLLIIQLTLFLAGDLAAPSLGVTFVDRLLVFVRRGKRFTDPINIELRLGEVNVGQSQINIRPAKVIIHPQSKCAWFCEVDNLFSSFWGVCSC